LQTSETDYSLQGEFCLGYKNPEHAVVEISVKNKSLGIKNHGRAVVEKSDKNKSLEFKTLQTRSLNPSIKN